MSGSPASPFFAPNKDSSDDTFSRDVIGNKGDSVFGSSVIGRLETAYQHIHMPGYVHPSDGTVVTATTGNDAGVFGDFVEMVAEDAIKDEFDTHWATVTNIGAVGVYVCELHIVDNAVLQASLQYLTAFPVARVDNFTRSAQVLVQMPPVPANSRIGLRALNNQAGEHTISVIIQYHKYE